MKPINLQPLKLISFISVAAAFILWAVYFIRFFDYQLLVINANNLVMQVNIASNLLIAFFSLIILVRTKSEKGILLIGLFLSLFSQNIALSNIIMTNNSWTAFIFMTLNKSLAGTVFIKAFQSFPVELTAHTIDSVFSKNRIFRRFTKWTLKNYTWFLFPVIIMASTFFTVFTNIVAPINFVILVVGFLCLYVNYKRLSHSEKNKILWLFWGILTNIFIVLISSILVFYNGEETQTLHNVVVMLQAAVIVFSLAMSLFFFDTFNTGAVITRTIADSSVFILIVIVYNTSEHYFLHWLSHELHLSDVLISSMLSGVFVMLFSPVHHRLMHFLEKKLKYHPVKHT